MKKIYLLLYIIFGYVSISFAQSPVVKVDINMSGRSEAECNDPNYVPWIPDNAASISKTVNGVTFTFKKAGSNGTALRATYYKAGVQAPYYARLGCDGMMVDGGNAGAQIELTISGLPTGKHSFMAFHNALDDPGTYNFSPIDVYVNNALVVNNLVPSERAVTTDALQSSYVTFNATAGTNVVISYRAETTSSANMKNVYINGFELNTPNVKNQAKNPVPTDGDLHVNGDNGSTVLKWTAGAGAVTHQIYFGTDKNCVATGTTSSSCYKAQQAGTSYNMSGLYSMDTYYWRVDEITSAGVVTKGNVWMMRPRQLAFPGAEGYGRYAIGGRGGKVVHVTNLNDSGTGSLRDAVENQTGPRTIVFDVAGIIILKSRLVLSDANVTIAGQTAPGKGICLRTAPMGFTGDDVIARHIRLRLGGGPTYDGMGMTGANHSIMDHCSISWTIDEAFSSRSGKNITMQRTFISEALNVAGHQNYPAGTAHGYAATIGGDVGSFHHNLLAHCEGRNWSLGGGLDGNAYYAGRLSIINNVVYNWGGRACDGGTMELDFVNNYYKPGAASTIFFALSMDHENTGLGMQRAYFTGNVMPGKFNESTQTAGRRETFSNGDSKKYECFVNTQFSPSYVTTQNATDAYKSVLSDVGANQPQFDDHDIRVVNETLNGTYKYKGSKSGKPGLPDNESDVGGYESYPSTSRASTWDSDGDGLPNFWETFYGTSNSSGSGNFSDANADPDKNGYTNLEDYINWMAEPHYIIAVNSQTIDLAAMFKGYTLTTPTYSVSAITNGTVSISGSTATFKATSCGFASFKLTVKDAAGSTMTRQVGVYISAGCATIAPKKYIYTYGGSGNYAWTNTGNWQPQGIPAVIDTAIIRTGEVQIAQLNQTAPVYVESAGTLRLTDDATVNNLHLQGGTLRVYTSNPEFDLQSTITVEKPSIIQAGSAAATVFAINGTITGSGSLTKTGVGILQINTAAPAFKGNWIVSEGKLQVKNATALGLCGAVVKGGASVDIAANATTYSLSVEANGSVILTNNLTVDVAVLGTTNLAAGTYTSANYPAFISGAGTLTVKNSVLALSTSPALCTGSSLKFTPATATSYQWFNSSAQVATSTTYTTSAAGNFSVISTNSNGCKMTSAAIAVTVNTLPTATITAPATAFCTGGSVVLTSSTGASYKWFNGTTQVGTDATYTATAAGSYTVEVTNAAGCKATSAATQITVNTLPTATITVPAASFCTGGSVVLTSSAGSSYKWFNGTTQVGTASTYTAAAAGSYTVEVTNVAGCKATSAATQITVNTLPTATITAQATSFCTGGSVILTSSAGSSYKWFNGTTQVGIAATYTAAAAGSYTVEVTNAAGCKATSAATQITVNTLPTATITAPATSFCTGGSVVLTANSGASYIWFNGTTQVGTAAAYTVTAAGSYTVEVTNAAGCKRTSAVTQISITTGVVWYADADGDGKGDPAVSQTACTQPIGYVSVAGDACPLDAAKVSAGACGCGQPETDTDNDGTPNCNDTDDDNDGVADATDCAPLNAAVGASAIWYQDLDGDGKGDASEILNTCTQPAGYVSAAGDACPLDAAKTSPGACGCGQPETDTDNDGTPNCNDTDDDNDGVADAADCAPLDAAIGTSITWYQDTDGDGKGDASSTLNACVQPVGYVSSAGDACLTDAAKTEAGNCGCGKAENSCLDCAGVPNGSAVLDNCSICTGGTTGKTACVTTSVTNGSSTGILVIPQPFDFSTTIKLENMGMIQALTVISASGAVVDYMQDMNTPEVTLGEDLVAGLYTVVIQSDKTTHIIKIVKK